MEHLITSFLITGCAVGIDSKLDFGSESSHPSFTGESIAHKNIQPSNNILKTISLIDPLESDTKPKLSCGEGGCNKTQSYEAGKDHIKTDVLIQIETQVDLSRQKESEDATMNVPDIPVIVGYKGARLDTTINDNIQGQITKPSILPSTHPFVDNTNFGNRRHYYAVPAVRRYNNVAPDGHHNPNVAPFTGYGSPYHGTSLYKTDNNVDIKPIAPNSIISTSDDDEMYPIHIKYKNNGTRITVPYFHPSFHSHYFGESPPPQHVWYPKFSPSINNVEFKTNRPSWTPSDWYKPYHHSHKFMSNDEVRNCFCETGLNGMALGWYPSVRRSINADSKMKIDDKLAPLN